MPRWWPKGWAPIRHMALRGNDIYVSTRHAPDQPSVGIIALRLAPDHKPLQTEHFGSVDGGTGIRIHNGALYASSGSGVYRFALDDMLVPKARAGTDRRWPGRRQPSRSRLTARATCSSSMRRRRQYLRRSRPQGRQAVGLKPCPNLETKGGIWRFDDSKPGQKFADGEHYATGIRNSSSLDWRDGDALYGAMHGRDATAKTWPDLVTEADDDAIGDEMHRMVKGTDFGWPYTYYDGKRKLRLVSPEYGGDGKTTARGDVPVASFQPMRPAPVDLAFYTGTQFPSALSRRRLPGHAWRHRWRRCRAATMAMT